MHGSAFGRLHGRKEGELLEGQIGSDVGEGLGPRDGVDGCSRQPGMDRAHSTEFPCLWIHSQAKAYLDLTPLHTILAFGGNFHFILFYLSENYLTSIQCMQFDRRSISEANLAFSISVIDRLEY